MKISYKNPNFLKNVKDMSTLNWMGNNELELISDSKFTLCKGGLSSPTYSLVPIQFYSLTVLA